MNQWLACDKLVNFYWWKGAYWFFPELNLLSSLRILQQLPSQRKGLGPWISKKLQFGNHKTHSLWICFFSGGPPRWEEWASALLEGRITFQVVRFFSHFNSLCFCLLVFLSFAKDIREELFFFSSLSCLSVLEISWCMSKIWRKEA